MAVAVCERHYVNIACNFYCFYIFELLLRVHLTDNDECCCCGASAEMVSSDERCFRDSISAWCLDYMAQLNVV